MKKGIYIIYMLIFQAIVLMAKTHEPVYQDPFDIAAGGASLSRASKEAILFSNPAQLSVGSRIYRWVGLQNTFALGKDSLEFAQSLAGGESEESGNFVQQVIDSPVHIGIQSSLSVLLRNMGFATFLRAEPDISAKAYDEVGLPQIRARAEVYGGAVAGLATHLWQQLHLGLTLKYLYKSEPDLSISVADPAAIQRLQEDPSALTNQAQLGQGLGYDVGLLYFYQGKPLDFRFAIKVDDVGQTTFTKDQTPFLQTVSTGILLSLHGSTSSIDFAYDVRDLMGAYDRSLSLRSYYGVKALMLGRLGVAAGMYEGSPTYGALVDLFAMRFGATFYTREMGEYLGDDPRSIYLAYMAVGW
jgi:hypothetical protein